MNKELSLSKWGNSTAVRIPKEILDQAHLHQGDTVSIHLREGAIVIEPVRKKPTLEQLLEGYEAGEIADWGNPQGQEAW